MGKNRGCTGVELAAAAALVETEQLNQSAGKPKSTNNQLLEKVEKSTGGAIKSSYCKLSHFSFVKVIKSGKRSQFKTTFIECVCV